MSQKLPIIIDQWTSELHQTYLCRHEATTWDEVIEIIKAILEAGDLANLLPVCEQKLTKLN